MGPDRQRLRFAVVGAGGVGGLLGGLLVRQADEVTFVATEAGVSVLNSQGLRIQSDRYGTFSVPAHAVSVLTSPVDVCVVAVKATELDAAMARLPEGVMGQVVVVPLLNGIDHVSRLRQVYGEHVVAGTARVASARIAPGVIKHSSPFMRIELALTDELGDQLRETAYGLARRLTAAGVDVEIVDDELSMIWGKLIFLCPLALLTTRYGIRAGDARTSHRDELVGVINEVANVGRAVGASLSAETALEFFDSVPATMTSSMQHDAVAGRPIELDAIGGAVLRAGERTGVPVPVTQRLVDEIQRSLTQDTNR